MGALILLLLVATRRIKNVAVQKATKARAAKIAESVRREAAETETLEPAPAFLPQLVSISANFDPDISAQKAAELRAQWRKTVEDLSQTYSDEVRTLAAIRAEAIQKEQADNKERTALETERQRLVIKKQELEASRAEMTRDETRLNSEAAATDDAARRTRKAVQIKAEELANQPVPYTLLPYDGQLGTTRRPIIIECDDRSITFVCEGVTLTAPQLSGFPSDFNPVLAGTRALFEYWSVKDRQNASLKTPPPPYVLLVVRPQGTIAFYVARKLLEQFDQPYGYELVTDDLELTWPASEERARTVCRDAVERVLKERERIASGLQGQRFPVANELRYDNEHGVFVTEEVERLRAMDESVVVGGQRWKREPGSGTGGELPGAFESAGSGSRGPGGAGGPGPSGGEGGSGNAPAGPGTPGAFGRPSPSSYREFSSTFQGSSGPRLGGSGSGTGTGGSGRRSGGLRPFPEYESNSAAPLVPQGTGPIAAPRQPGGGYSRGPGGRSSGGAGTSSGGTGSSAPGSGASTPGTDPQLAGGPGPYPAPGTGTGTGNGTGPGGSGGIGPGTGSEVGSPSGSSGSGGPGFGTPRIGGGTEEAQGIPGFGLVGEGGSGSNALGQQARGPARQGRGGQGGVGSGGGQNLGSGQSFGGGTADGAEGGGIDPFAEGAAAAPGSGRATGPAQLSPDGLWADSSELSRGPTGSGSGSGSARGSSRVPGEFGPEGLFEEDGTAQGSGSGTAMRGAPGSAGSGGQPGGFGSEGSSSFGGSSDGFAPGPGAGVPGSGGGGQGAGSAGGGGATGGGGGGSGGAPGFGSPSDPAGAPSAGGVPVYGAAPGGRSSSGRGSRSGSAPEGMPVPRNLRSIGQEGPSNGEPRERRWGDPEHSGVIALERTVTIHIREEGVLLEDEPEISLKNGAAYRELKDRLSQTLDRHVSQWGRPPASFYWLPNVTFRIHPGGNQYYQALKALTDEWGIHSTSEQVLE